MELDGDCLYCVTAATVVAAILLAFSACGNLALILHTTFKTDVELRQSFARPLMRHLAVAHLLISSFHLPTQMGWISMESLARENSWWAGEGACRLLAFLNKFPLMSSAFLITSMNLYQGWALVRPMDARQSYKTGKLMLLVSWVPGFICGAVEAIVYHVQKHPYASWWEECTFVGFFASTTAELTYLSTTAIIFFYAFPLVSAMICYSCMVRQTCETHRVSDNTASDQGMSHDPSHMERQALKLFTAISFLFFTCWGPHQMLLMWSYADRDFHSKVKPFLYTMLKECCTQC